jgi:hypothetical protein
MWSLKQLCVCTRARPKDVRPVLSVAWRAAFDPYAAHLLPPRGARAIRVVRWSVRSAGLQTSRKGGRLSSTGVRARVLIGKIRDRFRAWRDQKGSIGLRLTCCRSGALELSPSAREALAASACEHHAKGQSTIEHRCARARVLVGKIRDRFRAWRETKGSIGLRLTCCRSGALELSPSAR